MKIVLRLIAEAALPSAFGFVLTLNLLRGAGFETIFLLALTFVAQGVLLMGEFAALFGLRTLSYVQRLRAIPAIFGTLLIPGVVTLVVFVYIGLGGEGGSLSWAMSVLIGGGVIVGLSLGCVVALMPALLIDEDPPAAFRRAVRSVWRIPATTIVGVAYVGALLLAVWVGPDQLLLRTIVPAPGISLVRAAAGWVMVALAGIPFWALVVRLYVTPPRG